MNPAIKQYMSQIGRKGGLKRAVNPARRELARAAGLASQRPEVKAKRGLTIAKRKQSINVKINPDHAIKSVEMRLGTTTDRKAKRGLKHRAS